MTFEQWITEVKRMYETRNLADKSMADFSYKYWGGFYNDGYTPKDAYTIRVITNISK